VPFSRFGAPTINRLISPATIAFITELATASGADRSLTEPNGEIGLVTQRDPEWGDQHGGPRDPQPGNGRARYDDDGGKEDDRTLAPLQTEHGSTPSGGVPGTADAGAIRIESAINALAPLAPTMDEDADFAPGPGVPTGSSLVLTYLVTNASSDGSPISDVQVFDDAGTPGVPGDDLVPIYQGGDDGDGLLEVGEVWFFAAPAGLEARAGVQRHVATARGLSSAGNAVDDTDLVYYNGGGTTPASIRIEKAINAADPARPTAAEDADGAPGPTLLVGTPITWTYLVFNEGSEALRLDSIVDDFGTAGVAGDDFSPLAVTVGGFNVGDVDQDGLLDSGEAWRFTSAGTAAGGYVAVAGQYLNVATVSGTGMETGTVVQDDDVAYYLGVSVPTEPGVRLVKAVNAADPSAPTAYEDANFATGPILAIGSTVVWTYQVVNTGSTAFAVATLRDDAGTPLTAADDFSPVAVLAAGTSFNVGDLDRDNLVDVGESWLFRATGTVAAGQYANTGLVSVRDPVTGTAATASDMAHYFGTPVGGIEVVKAVNAVKPLAPTVAEDANNPASPVVLAAGSTVTFTYAVRNTGANALATVTLVDDGGTIGFPGDDFVPAPVTIVAGGKVYNTGDSNKNGLLDRTETWLFSATRVVTEGAYTNYATVSAVDSKTGVAVRDDDPANLFGAVAKIDIEKAVNAVDPTRPTVAEDADDPTQPVRLVVGTPVAFTYLVANAGNSALAVSSIRDDAGTPTVASDDFTPVAVLVAGFNAGDANRNDLLDVGEVWQYTSVGTAAGGTALMGLHTNVASVTGTDTRTGRTATDSDSASYLGVTGAIRVEKAINAVHPTAPTRYEDADFATGPILQVGTPIVWTYQVFNQSGVALDLVDLVDSDGFAPVYVSGDTDPDGRLGPEEVWLFTSFGVIGAPATARLGQHVNTVTVIAADDGGARYTDDDKAHYLGTVAGISIVKAINAVDPSNPTVAEDANDPDRPVHLMEGAIPTFTFQVRNLGTVELRDVVIVDDAATSAAGDDFAPVPVLKGKTNVGDTDRDGRLDPGETWLYTSAGAYAAALPVGAYVNVARVAATDVVTGATILDDDIANYLVSSPAPDAGRMTGGGSVYTEDGMRVTHGFELHCNVDVGPNNLEVNFDKNRFHLEQLTFVTCYDDPLLDPLPRPAPFDTLVGEGIGRFNGQSGYRVWFTFTDNGEPGTGDLARIEIRDPQGNLVLYVSGNLHNGNHQAHPENKDSMMAMTAASAEPGLTEAWFLAATKPLADTAMPMATSPSPQRVTNQTAVAIDWTRSAEGATGGDYLDDGMALDATTDGWQERFVNHLAATPEQLNPNAALQVYLPVAHQLSALS
jgi:archaellum component FlaG (FlaF/FlaG flagellin family)